MTTATANYPAGDLRLSDADRDRALDELSEAFEVGRITAAEFDERSRQALAARTGSELTALLADLPQDRAHAAATPPRTCPRRVAARIVTASSAAAATSLAALALANGLSRPAPHRYDRQLAEQILGHLGLKVSLPAAPPPPGFDWAGTITPAAIALLLVAVFVIALRAGRCGQGQPHRPAR
jgi:hypothetical protein